MNLIKCIYLALPLAAVMETKAAYKLARALVRAGQPDIALALLDVRKQSDRSFATKLFGSPDFIDVKWGHFVR